jgi:hypothetical protein
MSLSYHTSVVWWKGQVDELLHVPDDNGRGQAARRDRRSCDRQEDDDYGGHGDDDHDGHHTLHRRNATRCNNLARHTHDTNHQPSPQTIAKPPTEVKRGAAGHPVSAVHDPIHPHRVAHYDDDHDDHDDHDDDLGDHNDNKNNSAAPSNVPRCSVEQQGGRWATQSARCTTR